MIPYGRQEVTDEDIEAVIRVLKSEYLTQGKTVPQFEELVSSYCGAKYAVAVNSATSALHVACLALGLGPQDWLWTTANTFVASANCALYCGAQVDFVDIDPKTYNLSTERLSLKLALAKKQGKIPKILIPVHFAGQSCEMEAIYKLSKEYGFRIIEDASHAIGGGYKNQTIGNCRYSDITVFSFHPVKIITSGEGGMALTNDKYLSNKMQKLRSHGITSQSIEMEERPTNELWNYQQVDLGFNYRMTDIHAALGVSQMSRLSSYVNKRQLIAARYDIELADLPLLTPWQNPSTYSSYHLYPVKLSLGEINKTQKEVYSELQSLGILVNLHYIPVYRQPYYEKKGFHPNYCPNAEDLYRNILSIPIYPSMTEDDQTTVIQTLKKVLKS